MIEHEKLDFDISVENDSFFAILPKEINGISCTIEAAIAFRLKAACKAIDELKKEIAYLRGFIQLP